MADRCPRCRLKLEDSRLLACPNCGYTLRLPMVGKLGAFLMVAGFFALLGTLFLNEMWMEAMAGGIGAIVAGLVAILVAGRMIGRSRRA